MKYVATQDFEYHGVRVNEGEELDDRIDYIASGDGIEPDMFGEWLHRGWIVSSENPTPTTKTNQRRS